MARPRLVSKLSQRMTSCLLMILLLFLGANVYKISFFTYFRLVKTFNYESIVSCILPSFGICGVVSSFVSSSDFANARVDNRP